MLLALALAGRASAETLRVGVSDDYPPFSVDGAGFDVEVAKRFARWRGEEIEWVRFRWPELGERARSNAFDVVMSGVTWRPERDVLGWMSRAVAIGGPCVVGAEEPRKVGVNRGGILEQFARGRFAEETLVIVAENRSLPSRLEKGEIDAAITDSFERATFPKEAEARCEPRRDRKVYWATGPRAAELGPAIDAWLAAEENRIDELRTRELGGSAPWTAVDHFVDLLARRIALMPAVAATKRERGQAIEDREREQHALNRVRSEASASGIAPKVAVAFFETQIALAKEVQRRSTLEETELDLERDLRPALDRLTKRILIAWSNAAAIAPKELDRKHLALFEPLLTPVEIDRQAQAIGEALRIGQAEAATSTTNEE